VVAPAETAGPGGRGSPARRRGPALVRIVGQLVAVEGIARCINEARDNDSAKIEHETVGERHYGHVTVRTPGRAKKTDDFVFPGAAGELEHVLGRGGDIKIIYRRRHDYPVRFLDRLVQFLRRGI